MTTIANALDNKLGIPVSGNLTNCTSLPISGISGLGTGIGTALAANVNGSGAISLTTSPTFVTPALGTPSSGSLGSCSNCAQSALTGLGTGVSTALGINIGSAGAPVVFNGALGQPSSGDLTHCTNAPAGTTTFTGDSGSATTNSGAIIFNAASQAGATTSFSATSHTVSLNLTDASHNTALGAGAGSFLSGSSNLYIMNAGSTENNVMRIGTQGNSTGQQNYCYLAGISNTPSFTGSGDSYLMYIDHSNQQTYSIVPDTAANNTTDFGQMAVGVALQNTKPYAILVNLCVSAVFSPTGGLLIGVDSTNSPVAKAVTPSLSGSIYSSFSFIVPALYYAELTTSGSTTVNDITTFVSQVG